MTGASIDAALTEYKELKQEQRMRMTSRDNLGYWIFPALAVVGGVALSGPGRQPLLLLLPLVCIALGWAYLGNDTKVTQIGNYIRIELAPLVRESDDEPMPFGWERYHRQARLRGLAAATHPLINLAVFCAPAWAVLAAFAVSAAGNVAAWWALALLPETLLIGILTALFIAHGWPPRRPAATS